ncbi:MAG: metallophosphoesterase [Thalassovita sp.]
MSSRSIYAVGDIHGFIDQLDWALAQIEKDGGEDAEIVFLGDLVDRGPDSRAVINRLSDGIEAGRNWTVLCGNHDDLFATFLETGNLYTPRVKSGLPWSDPRLGGLETLRSYGVDVDRLAPTDLLSAARDHVPHRHLKFIRSLPHYTQRGGLMMVHGGLKPGVPMAQQDPQDLMWIRTGFLDYPNPYPWVVVHGHTALSQPEHLGNRVNLDSGAGYGRPITAAVFEMGQVWTLSPFGREPLRQKPNPYPDL